jgi:hypothetical protein
MMPIADYLNLGSGKQLRQWAEEEQQVAIDAARILPLHVNINSTSASGTIDLGVARPFLAWMTVNMIDPTINFDRDNAIAADIFTVDGARTASRVFGGDHFGSSGSAANVFQGAFFGVGRRVTFFLRAFGPDVNAAAECVVVI